MFCQRRRGAMAKSYNLQYYYMIYYVNGHLIYKVFLENLNGGGGSNPIRASRGRPAGTCFIHTSPFFLLNFSFFYFSIYTNNQYYIYISDIHFLNNLYNIFYLNNFIFINIKSYNNLHAFIYPHFIHIIFLNISLLIPLIPTHLSTFPITPSFPPYI